MDSSLYIIKFAGNVKYLGLLSLLLLFTLLAENFIFELFTQGN